MEMEEVNGVKTLRSLPEFDKDREFVGISTLKMDKKDRHMKTLQEFSKFLEGLNESVVQEVLTISRLNLLLNLSVF